MKELKLEKQNRVLCAINIFAHFKYLSRQNGQGKQRGREGGGIKDK